MLNTGTFSHRSNYFLDGIVKTVSFYDTDGHVALSWPFFSKFWIIFINSNMIYSISNPFHYLEYLYPAQVPFFFF